MLIYALSFLLGIVLFSNKNTLEISTFDWGLITCLLLAILMLFKRSKILSISLAFLMLGFMWMGLFSAQMLAGKVDNQYLNKPIHIVGKVSALPEASKQKTKFIFHAEKPFKGKLKLSWYGKNLPVLKTDDEWQLLVKLKQNNGYQNSGGFDYEQWLFYQKIDATGYVKKSANNRLIKKSNTVSIDKFRQKLQRLLQPFLTNLTFGGVINALIIGDRSFITDQHWSLFKSTNTTHLSVISGLHIGLISGFVFLAVSLLWRRCTRCALCIPAQVIASYFGIISALIYALMAGFSIPTQRAFVMAGVVFLSIILRRHHHTWQLYGLALILVLIINPSSIFSIGFWLSFYVVAVIIYTLQGAKNKHWLTQLIALQISISIATLPLVAWFFNSGSLLSPIANLIAIPIFSFLIVPAALLGTILALFNLEPLANATFTVGNQALIYLSDFLDYLQSFDFNQWHYTPSSNIDLIMLIAAVGLLVLPKQLRLRAPSVLILILILLSPTKTPSHNSVLITILDVGQGLAHVVQTKNHVLLFDTGAAYPSGFNLGEAVVTPYLKSQQIKHLNKIILSHGDNDHIGGLKSILKTFSTDEILSSVPAKMQQNAKNCNTRKIWVWDGVRFELFNTNSHLKGNNNSCVLKVSTNKHAILFSADIEKQAEKHLVSTLGNKLRSDILIVPHHGSKTSSTPQFIKTVAPKFAIISSGYQNRFKHPAKAVLDRYEALNIQTLNTPCTGQIDIHLTDVMSINQYRKDNARYYMRQCQ